MKVLLGGKMRLIQHHRGRRRARMVPVLAAAAALAAPIVSDAGTDNYIGPNGGNWNDPTNWSTGSIPAGGDTANIIQASTGTFSFSFDGNYSTNSALTVLKLDSGTGASLVLNQSTPGDNLTAVIEDLGYSGVAIFNQTAATNTVTDTLYLGGASGQGTYLLGNGATLISQSVYVGSAAQGTFVQSGGNVQSSEILAVGYFSGGNGIYQFSGGSISGNYLILGELGANGPLPGSVGSFVQTGGSASFATLYAGANTGGSSGLYQLSAGSLTVSGTEYIGQATGSFGASAGRGYIYLWQASTLDQQSWPPQYRFTWQFHHDVMRPAISVLGVQPSMKHVSFAGVTYNWGKGMETDWSYYHHDLFIPAWLMLVLTAILPTLWLLRRRRQPNPAGLCPACGYDLRATPERCPECGRASSEGTAG
jgi:hypothetical protein